MELLKKKHHEIIALYKLEKEVCDIYVEGSTDKVFIENYLRNKRKNRKIVPIEIIDFSELPYDFFEGLDINSNRNKVLVLSKLLSQQLPETNVRCIVDKDFEDYIKSISNNKLLTTDFSCLESYLFCEDVLDKFLEIGIGNFPYRSKFILHQLASVLKPLFCLRLLRELQYPSTKLVEIDGNLRIDKTKGTINFNQSEYLNKYIDKNNLGSKRSVVVTSFEDLLKRLNMEVRHHINGHDFLKIFFLYVNKRRFQLAIAIF